MERKRKLRLLIGIWIGTAIGLVAVYRFAPNWVSAPRLIGGIVIGSLVGSLIAWKLPLPSSG